ncbi:fibro-slime domain-containing protein [Candidatus Parabeggiatoa sp. HSG14]|uniref:fibro-slime domain-containing protein n=1 Tax=Candidatus Parabeggiatoa sp. HSG14 TaxID=3055593 RepID=UPI0025A859E3|nr:fibro-slime domain-containing protein [Thiotrichales bacterium HSG14]
MKNKQLTVAIQTIFLIFAIVGATSTPVYAQEQAVNAPPVVVDNSASSPLTDPPDTIIVTGIVRDFSKEHADFEGKISGLAKGCVEEELGPNDKPVVAEGNQCAITKLEDWYSDDIDASRVKVHDITLKKNEEGVYSFESNSFFPVDEELDGNEGNSHNYHFTYEIHGEFTYRKGQVFHFKGDDDLWVYINKKLVIDVGGVHSAESDKVNLDDLDLVEGETYPLELFFAERHTTQSNFKMETDLVLEKTNPIAEIDFETLNIQMVVEWNVNILFFLRVEHVVELSERGFLTELQPEQAAKIPNHVITELDENVKAQIQSSSKPVELDDDVIDDDVINGDIVDFDILTATDFSLEKIVMLTAEDIEKMSAEIVASFSKEQLSAVPATSIVSFTSIHISLMSVTTVTGFQREQVSHLRFETMHGFSQEKFVALDAEAMGGLTVEHLQELDEDVLDLDKLSEEQKNNLPITQDAPVVVAEEIEITETEEIEVTETEEIEITETEEIEVTETEEIEITETEEIEVTETEEIEITETEEIEVTETEEIEITETEEIEVTETEEIEITETEVTETEEIEGEIVVPHTELEKFADVEQKENGYQVETDESILNVAFGEIIPVSEEMSDLEDGIHFTGKTHAMFVIESEMQIMRPAMNTNAIALQTATQTLLDVEITFNYQVDGTVLFDYPGSPPLKLIPEFTQEDELTDGDEEPINNIDGGDEESEKAIMDILPVAEGEKVEIVDVNGEIITQDVVAKVGVTTEDGSTQTLNVIEDTDVTDGDTGDIEPTDGGDNTDNTSMTTN